MDYYVNENFLVYPTISWANSAPFDPRKQERRRLVERTEFPTAKTTLVDFFTVEIGPDAPTTAPSAKVSPTMEQTPILSEITVTSATADSATRTDADVERIAKQRVQLMAAKYASGGKSLEIVARLEILNRRLLDQAPRISTDQVAALENANNELVRIRAAREERARRLGIPTKL